MRTSFCPPSRTCVRRSTSRIAITKNGMGQAIPGLKGEQIPLVARIFAVADVWDALRSDRPYRKGWSDEQALQYIREQSGTHFDPKVAGLFLKTEPLRG